MSESPKSIPDPKTHSDMRHCLCLALDNPNDVSLGQLSLMSFVNRYTMKIGSLGLKYGLTFKDLTDKHLAMKSFPKFEMGGSTQLQYFMMAIRDSAFSTLRDIREDTHTHYLNYDEIVQLNGDRFIVDLEDTLFARSFMDQLVLPVTRIEAPKLKSDKELDHEVGLEYENPLASDNEL